MERLVDRYMASRLFECLLEHIAHCREDAQTLYDCFHNIDEENLFKALKNLYDIGIAMNKPICF